MTIPQEKKGRDKKGRKGSGEKKKTGDKIRRGEKRKG